MACLTPSQVPAKTVIPVTDFGTQISQLLPALFRFSPPLLQRSFHIVTFRYPVVSYDQSKIATGKMSGELPQRFETLQLHAGYVLLSAMGCHDCADKMLTARSLTRRLGLARHPSTRPLCVLATPSCAMASKTDLRSLTCSMTPHTARGCSASRSLAISTVAL